MYQHLESLLLKSTNREACEEDIEEVAAFYDADIDKARLRVQLLTLTTNLKDADVTLQDVVAYFKDLSPPQRQIYSEVLTALNLILVNPSTNAISERSFSAVRHIKTYLRSTMSQVRVNNLMVLHIHKEKTDNLSMVDVANKFVNSEHRMSCFGKFT